MPDQESVAAANPPVAPQPTPQPVPSLYDGLRVRALVDPTAGAIPSAVTAAENLGSQVKEIAADPTKRRDFIHGTLVGMASGTGEFGEVPEIYEGLRVRKADNVMVHPEATSRATPTGKGGKLPAELHANLEKQAGRELTDAEAIALDRANLERDMVTAPEGNTNAVREAKRDQLEQPRSVKKNASGESAASQEAINRLAAEKLGGVKRVKIDTRSGKETPLIGVDAADAKPGAHDVIVTRSGGKETLLDKGEKARYKKSL